MSVSNSYESKIAALYQELDDVNATLKPLEDKRSDLHRAVRKLKNDYAIHQMNSLSTFEDSMRFFLDTTKIEGSTEVYSAMNKFFSEQLTDLYTVTFVPETNQRCFTITVAEDGSDIDSVIADIEKLLPFLKPCKRLMVRHNEASAIDCIPFDVMEHSCGDDNSFTMYLDVGTNEWVITSYWSSRTPHRYPDLRTALNGLISLGGYYECIEEDEEDDYDY